jgi:hypothetical protein
MSLSQTEILTRAERLASTLAGGRTRVEKNVLLSVVADFLSDPRAELPRLRRTLQLLRAGSGGHLERSDSYRQQIQAVVEELDKTLAEGDLSPGDYKSLFGWTARLLLVRGGPAERSVPPGRTDEQTGVRPLPPRPPAAPFGAVLPAPPKKPKERKEPDPTPTVRRGDRIVVEVVRIEARRYFLRPVGGGEEIVFQGGVSWEVGETKKVRVVELSGDGRVRKVAPA